MEYSTAPSFSEAEDEKSSWDAITISASPPSTSASTAMAAITGYSSPAFIRTTSAAPVRYRLGICGR